MFFGIFSLLRTCNCSLKLIHRNLESYMDFVAFGQFHPVDQPRHNHMLGFGVGLVKAVSPGKQFVNLRLRFFRALRFRFQLCLGIYCS